MDSLEDIFQRLRQPENNCSPDFRLFITTEPHTKFSIGLLQMSLKVTNEPPKGLRAGLLRSYTVIIDQDRLERIETSTWRALLFSLCFLHSIIQERRKFGSLGWCLPYEFNESDLNATIMFLEKHIDSCSSMNNISWQTVQYMAAEVQYGGRITDSMDRRLFLAYTETFLAANILQTGHNFNPDHPVNKMPDNFVYRLPDYLELEEYQNYASKLPNADPPEIIGLHPNADLTFRYKEVLQLLHTVSSVQPKQDDLPTLNGKKKQSKDDLVIAKCQELLQSMPLEYMDDEYEEKISSLGGLDVPLNIFLYQEIQRLQQIIGKVRMTLNIVMQAMRGEVVVTTEVLSSIDAIIDGRVPNSWLFR
jgi:dynein heavy chain, axonemal